MADEIETLVASAPIKCSADKFYNFFKYNLSDVVQIFSSAFKGADLHEGEEGTEGCVKLWSYIIEGIPLTAKVRTEAIDDAGKSIKFAVLEGDVMQLYNSFEATLSVSEGLAEWRLEFAKATLNAPSPEPYVSLAVSVCVLVDDYLLND